jgi:transposase-like protein
MPGKKGMVHYPKSVKLMAIKMFNEEGKTQKEITELLGIRDEQRIKKWLIEHRKLGASAFTKSVGRPRKSSGYSIKNPDQYIKQLEMENDMLKKFLELSGRWYPNK